MQEAMQPSPASVPKSRSGPAPAPGCPLAGHPWRLRRGGRDATTCQSVREGEAGRMSTSQRPAPDAGTIAQKPQIVAALQAVLPADAVISDPAETRAYECDALTAYRCPPLAVVLPRTTEEVAAAMRICHDMGVPVVPRGAGTSLA